MTRQNAAADAILLSVHMSRHGLPLWSVDAVRHLEQQLREGDARALKLEDALRDVRAELIETGSLHNLMGPTRLLIERLLRRSDP